MSQPTHSCAQALVRLLEGYGVDCIFGIPGVHTVELYRALADSKLRHVSPRHEQGAGFMADGYARASGKPGVCFIITGPGMTNILTAMGQAYADSIPMLVISTTSRREHQRLGHGYLHEMPDQRATISGVCAFSHSLQRVDELPEVLARAFALFSCARPRPVHIEIPLDVLEMSVSGLDLSPRPLPLPSVPAPKPLEQAAALLSKAQKPLILAGGGAKQAAKALKRLAEQLQAPVALTTNARGLLPPEHPLLLDGVQSSKHGRELMDQADAVLAIGTELGETDYDFFALGPISFKAPLIRLDIDPLQLISIQRAEVCLLGDAKAGIEALLTALPAQPKSKDWGENAVKAVNQQERTSWTKRGAAMQQVLDCVRDSLSAPIIVGDSTQPVYQGTLGYRAPAPATWFNASTGFGTLGYALPAGIGAKLGKAHCPVVVLAGDGGLQFTSSELICAKEAGIGILLLIWNNRCYGEIRDYMAARDIPLLGVDIHTPDFSALAAAYQVPWQRARNLDELAGLLKGLQDSQEPQVIELSAADFLSV